MWVVADLDEDYIAHMEDVLELYERPYNPRQPVVCLDESPSHCTRTCDRPQRLDRDAKRGETTNTNVAEPPMFSVP